MQDHNTPKHTPGPWGVCRHGYESPYMAHCFIENADGSAICGQWWPAGNDECSANAALIAAAPELLEACRVALAGYRGLTGDDDGPEYFERTLGDVMNALSAAIAKAEGRS